MISFDTNLLLYSLNRDCAEYNGSRAFFASLPSAPGEVVLSELVLVELYVLLRNRFSSTHLMGLPLSPLSKPSVKIPLGSSWIIRAKLQPSWTKFGVLPKSRTLATESSLMRASP